MPLASSFRRFSPLAVALLGLLPNVASLAAAPVAVELAPLKLDGTYSDKGMIVASATGPKSGTISFRGLLDFEFDPALNPELHPAADTVTLTHKGRYLSVKVTDTEGEPEEERWWHYEERVNADGRCAMAGFPDPANPDGKYFLVLQIVSDNRILQVKVLHLSPTAFGPDTKEIGTYVFPREG